MSNEHSDEFPTAQLQLEFGNPYIKKGKNSGYMAIRSQRLTLLSVLVFTNLTIAGLILGTFYSDSFAYAVRANVSASNPTVVDPELDVELYFKGLRAPTSMIFLGPDDILVTQKNEGTVERIINATQSPQPLITVPAASKDERGLLGVAISTDPSNKTLVFLYYTEKGAKKGEALGNRIYKYELNENASKLLNPKLLLDLPWEPGPGHNGGVLKIGPDKNIYLIIGDVMRTGHNESKLYETQMQNLQNGKEADGRAGILRITQSGQPVGAGIIGDTYPLNLFYAYGIKNSFGIDFDPLTGTLWDTENGPAFGDEINLVEAGFNSGWKQLQGIWKVNATLDKENLAPTNPEGLVNFDGKGKYSTPEFTWDKSIGPTALTFLSTDKLGMGYKNDILVGDIKYGNIYHFKLNADRNSLDLNGELIDRVANSSKEISNVIFAYGFGGITDLEVGPDGNLYVLVYDKQDGRIYRIH